MNICRVQSLDNKQSYQDNFLNKLNFACKNMKVKSPVRSPLKQSEKVPEMGRITYTPGDNAELLNPGFGEGMRQKQASNDGRSPYQYGNDSNDKLSSGSDNDPISMSMLTPHNYLNETDEEMKKEGTSKMADKMKSMQAMLNQKLKKVKNINWDLDE